MLVVLQILNYCVIIVFVSVIGYFHIVINQITNEIANFGVERKFLRRTSHAHFEEQRNRIGIEVYIGIQICRREFLRSENLIAYYPMFSLTFVTASKMLTPF